MKRVFLNLILLSASTWQSAAQTEHFATHRKLCDLPSEVVESSGLVIVSPAIIWTHGDSGTENEIFQVDTLGRLLRRLRTINAPNIDWEDMCTDKQGNIWINDAGNNSNGRTDLRMLCINAPHLHDSTEVHAEMLYFTFSDQTEFPPPRQRHNYDIEGIFHWNDSLHLFTKDRSNPFTGFTKRYVLPAKPGNYLAHLRDSFHIASSTQLGRITAADISEDGSMMVLLSLRQVIVFSEYNGTDFFGGKVYYYPFQNPTNQIEAIGFVGPDRLYKTDEVPGALYEVTLTTREKVGTRTNSDQENMLIYDALSGCFKLTGDYQNVVQLTVHDMKGSVISCSNIADRLYKPINTLVPGIYWIHLLTTLGFNSERILVP